MRLIFGDSSRVEPGHYPLPIQTSRILLYAGYFFAGVGVGAVSLRAGMLAGNGLLVKRWIVWLTFAMFSAAMTFTVPAVFLRFARSSFWLLDAVRPSAYGIYLLHFIFLIWLQYIGYDPAFPVFVKFAIVFTGTLSMSWALTVLLRRIPIVARTIYCS